MLLKVRFQMEGKEGVDFGIVFDIDGVIYRGGKLIPGARETIQKVQTASMIEMASILEFRFKNWAFLICFLQTMAWKQRQCVQII